MSAFSDLLREGNTEKWSNREIARRSDGRLSRATVDTYMKDGHGIPTEEIIDAFHSVLSIPRTELRLAAGLPAGENSPYTPPAEANLLDHRQRRAVDELIRSIVATRGAAHAMDSPPGQAEPSTQESPTERQKTQFRVFAVRESSPEAVSEWMLQGDSEREIIDTLLTPLRMAGFKVVPDEEAAGARVDLIARGPDGDVLFEVVGGDSPIREEHAIEQLRRAVGARRSSVRAKSQDPGPFPLTGGKPAFVVTSNGVEYLDVPYVDNDGGIDWSDRESILALTASSEGSALTVGDVIDQARTMSDDELRAAADESTYLAQFVRDTRPELFTQHDFELGRGDRHGPGPTKGEQLREQFDRDAEGGDPEGPEGGA